MPGGGPADARWVNGELIGRALLRHGDVVRVGNTRVTICLNDTEGTTLEPLWSDQGEAAGIEFMSKVVGEASLDDFQSQTLQFLSDGRVDQTLHAEGSAWLTRRTRSVTALYRAGRIVQRQPTISCATRIRYSSAISLIGSLWN